MSVMIGHASKDEHGKYSGGKAGDQTGQEVCSRSWYNRPWNVVCRCTYPKMREKIAYAMKAAANNINIGYSQGSRNSLLTYARGVGYDPARVTTPCNTDCSALVSLCCMYAGIPESALYKGGNSSTTGNLRSRLKATGKFEILTGKEYVSKPDNLVVGDILIYEGHHTAVVVQTDPKTEKTATVEPAAAPTEVLKKGSSGSGVLWLQKKLNKLGYVLEEDGIFGMKTLAAVQDFQRKSGLLCDGKVGQMTVQFLMK